MSQYARQNIAYWTTRAPSYSAVNQEELASSQHRVWRTAITRRIAQHFGATPPEALKILDVGTGPGFFAIILAELGYQVTAVDYTEAMLQQARHNAGGLAGRIQFRTMDAEALDFPDGAFDVVISRNVTWNLRHPDQAYSHWVRVLRPGGLLLNFDANWYRYLFDQDAAVCHRQDRDNVARAHAADNTAGTDVEAMEAIARQAPLSAHHRPGWDLEVLQRYRMSAHAEPDIWKQVWIENERINNASTPMFLVMGVKCPEA